MQLYRFNGSDHAETPQNEVTGIAAEKLRAMFEEEARKWWTSGADSTGEMHYLSVTVTQPNIVSWLGTCV